jgi:ribose transport system substrate-binding protein
MSNVVVLDAGGDVARQIAQMEDLIQQQVDAIIIWPTNGQAVIPAVRKAHQAGIPVVITNSNIAEDGFDFISSFSGPDNVTQGQRAAEIMCDRFTEMGIADEARIVQITGQPGYTTAIERAEGFEERLPEVCPNVTLVDSQPGNWNRETASA